MALEINGKLVKVLPEQTGTGKAGPWTKQEFIIETQDQYPRKVCFSSWNEKTGILKKLNEGDMLKVSFNAESRDYNGRWYTDLRAWKVELQSSELGHTAPPRSERTTTIDGAGTDAGTETAADADDLPF